MAKVRDTKESKVALTGDMVEVLVLPNGDGRISNGQHHPKLGDEFFEAGERFEVDRAIALGLEGRGFAVRTSLMNKPQHVAAAKVASVKDGQ